MIILPFRQPLIFNNNIQNYQAKNSDLIARQGLAGEDIQQEYYQIGRGGLAVAVQICFGGVKNVGERLVKENPIQ